MSIKSFPFFVIKGHFGFHLRRQSGVSLFELIFFMVIVSIGLVGILSVMDLTTRHSADPLQRKQALAIAEAILEEVQLLPMAITDPCREPAEAGAPCAEQDNAPVAGAKARGSLENPFTVVDDYNGLTLSEGATPGSIADAVVIPAGYGVGVTVQTSSLGPIAEEPNAATDAAARLITVTVTYDQGREKMVVQGYRGSYDVLEGT